MAREENRLDGGPAREERDGVDEVSVVDAGESKEPIAREERRIEGPPHVLQLQIYNLDTAAALVGGYIVVRDPFAVLAQHAMLYEFLTSKDQPAQDVSPETKTPLTSTIKKDGDPFKLVTSLKRGAKHLVVGKSPEPAEHLPGK